VALGLVAAVSRETVRQALKKQRADKVLTVVGDGGYAMGN